jgi:putative FmdB family regulatory protein
MKKLFEFLCSHCDHYFEELIEYTKTIECPECGKEASKLISAPNFYLEGVTGSFPSAAMSWDKKHIQKLAEEKKKQD